MPRTFPRPRIAAPITLAVFVLALTGCAQAAPVAETGAPATPVFEDSFWKVWGDGKAELAGYDLVTPRYGQLRHGTAVAIFVTETFSNSLRVKSDPGKHPKSDEFPVMKLNLVQDFPTGIYDYNLMTSAFNALAPVNGRPAGGPTKVSFSAQEWCGNAYAQLLFDDRKARLTAHSYFDGEADRTESLTCPDDAVAEDALLLWARGFAFPLVASGASATRPLVRSLREVRLLHQPESLRRATFTRDAAPSGVTVPAGTIECDRSTVAVEGGRTWTFWVERAAPHRLVQWQCSDGEKAQLLGSDRLPYWTLHDEGGQSYLAKLGLTARGPRMP